MRKFNAVLLLLIILLFLSTSLNKFFLNKYDFNDFDKIIVFINTLSTKGSYINNNIKTIGGWDFKNKSQPIYYEIKYNIQSKYILQIEELHFFDMRYISHNEIMNIYNYYQNKFQKQYGNPIYKSIIFDKKANKKQIFSYLVLQQKAKSEFMWKFKNYYIIKMKFLGDSDFLGIKLQIIYINLTKRD